MHDEIMAVHAVMWRASDLIRAALKRLRDDGIGELATILSTGHWFARFVQQHYESDDELLWPILHRSFPESSDEIESLARQHIQLMELLDDLALGLRMLKRIGRRTDGAEVREARAVLAVASEVHSMLENLLETETFILGRMLARSSSEDIRRLRGALIHNVPRSRPSLLLGLMQDPQPCAGADALLVNLPIGVRLCRPILLRLYWRRIRRLEA